MDLEGAENERPPELDPREIEGADQDRDLHSLVRLCPNTGAWRGELWGKFSPEEPNRVMRESEE
jgi:hypothetical protein